MSGRLVLILATGVGFLAVTGACWLISGANPFRIWLWNAHNHGRFYVEFPRRYLAWVLVNPIELSVALGLPIAVVALVGLAGWFRRNDADRPPTAAWATLAVLAILTLSGRSLSEVARLWIPFLPALVAAGGRGIARVGGGRPALLGATVFLAGVQTLALEALIQVVYPV